MIKLVATDVDGTLVKDSSPEVYSEMIEMIKKLREQGIIFCIASGRQSTSIEKMFHEIKDDLIFLADNGAHVGRIARDPVMQIVPHADVVKALYKALHRLLAHVLRDDHRAHQYAHLADQVNEPEHFQIVGDADIRAHFGLFYVGGVDADHDLRFVAELLQQFDLAVYIETRQHARRVKIVEDLAAEFQIKLVVEFGNAFDDVAGLLLHIELAVKTDLTHIAPSRLLP